MKRVIWLPCPICQSPLGSPCVNKRTGLAMKHCHITRLPQHKHAQLNRTVAQIEKDPDPDGFWAWAWDYLGLNPDNQYWGDF